MNAPTIDYRYQLLKEMTQVLDEGFPQYLEIDAAEVKNEPMIDKPDSPIRLATVNGSRFAPTPVSTAFTLSYGSANLQSSTALRLQKIKNKFVEVDFNRTTPDTAMSKDGGRERRRMLLSVMNRAPSGRSNVVSRSTTLATSPCKSRMSLVSAKHIQLGLSSGAVSPTKSLSMSTSMSRPTSTMSRTCCLQ